MAIHRGIQSAIFYYLSCAPCAEARVRKKRKREAMLDRADREALEAEMPNLYRHPSPSSTNPYWGAEIAAGPVLSSRGKRKGGGGGYSQANDSQRRLKTATTDRSAGSSADLASRVASRDAVPPGPQRPNADILATMGSAERLPPRSTVVSASSLDGGSGSGITRPPTAVTRDKVPGASYDSFSNPHVNDLVPAIATQVNSREDAAALMLGPPSAEYMAGRRVDLARSRSTSGGSSQLTARSLGIPLSREVSRRMIERKLHGGETLSTLTVGDCVADRPAIEAKDFAQSDDSLPAPSQSRGDSHASEDSARTVLHEPLLAPEPVHRYLTPTRIVSRPQLSTIISSDNVTNSESTTTSSTLLENPTVVPKENGLPPFLLRSAANNHSDTSIRGEQRDRTSRRSPVLDAQQPNLEQHSPTSSRIHIIRGLKSPLHPDTPLFNTDIFTSTRSGSAEYPGDGENNTSAATPGGGAMFDSWYTPDFALPEWVHEHTKREVSQRWSMDI